MTSDLQEVSAHRTSKIARMMDDVLRPQALVGLTGDLMALIVVASVGSTEAPETCFRSSMLYYTRVTFGA
jgi:hypothetical protein